MEKINIEKYEHQFAENYYNGVNKCKDYEVLKGKIPILISAPHSVKQYLEDGNEKVADIYTGTIVKYVHKKTYCYAIYKTVAKGNANYDRYSEYYNNIINLIQKNNIKLFIDVHGAANNRDFDIDIADHFGETLVEHYDIANLFKEKFIAHCINKVVENEIFVASEHTLTYRIAKKFSIPCIELEINAKYRNPYNDKVKFMELLESLCDIILKINGTYLK